MQCRIRNKSYLEFLWEENNMRSSLLLFVYVLYFHSFSCNIEDNFQQIYD